MTEGAASDKTAAPTFDLLSPADIEALPDLEYLIEGILPVPAFGVLYGPPGAGKSFVALSMALAVANGAEWLGRAVRAGKVLYVVAEGVTGMKQRLQAYRARFGIADDCVRFIRVPFNARVPADIAAVLATLTRAAVKNLAHSASLHSVEKSAPSKFGTKHLLHEGVVPHNAIIDLLVSGQRLLTLRLIVGWRRH